MGWRATAIAWAAMLALSALIFPNAARAQAVATTSVDQNGRAKFDAGQAAYDKEDYKNAGRYLAESCALNFATACYNLALMHANGKAGAVDFSKAAEFYERGCKLDDQQACNNLGVQYQNGRGVALNAASAIFYYRRSCTIEAGLGCANLSTMLEKELDDSKPSLDPRWVEVATLNKKACTSHPHGCLRYGYNLTTGLGVVRNDAEAAKQFIIACEGKVSSGCYNLGVAYDEAKGVRRDAALSARYFEWSCELGNAEGCDGSGMALMRKGKLAQGAVDATSRFAKACEGGVGGTSAGGDPVAAACARAAFLMLAGDSEPSPDIRAEAERVAGRGCGMKEASACLVAALASREKEAEWLAQARGLEPDAAALRSVEKAVRDKAADGNRTAQTRPLADWLFGGAI